MGEYLKERLDHLVQSKDSVIERRGVGLMQGIRLSAPPAEAIKAALQEGLLLISAGDNVIRLVPPLVIKKEHVDEMIRILKKIL